MGYIYMFILMEMVNMTNINITELNKNIPVTYTGRQKNIKLYIHWDEFYILSNPQYTIQQIKEHIQENCIPWMKQRLQQYSTQVADIQTKIKNENLQLEYRSKDELKSLIHEYLEKYSYKGTPHKVYIRTDMNRSWATHSYNHNLSFSDKLQYVPKELVEYNVYHELCHYDTFEHDETFYKAMSEVYPNWQEYDKLANAYSYMIVHNNYYHK